MPKPKKFEKYSQKEILELKQKSDEYLTCWQRAQADLENFQKRSIVEKEEFRKFAIENIILQILPVLDNFQLAINHLPEDQKDSSWVIGILHIQKQLIAVLSSFGVEEIEIKPGDEFNPENVEALETIDSPDFQSGQIVRLVQSGYKLNGKVIRHGKVVVVG